MESVDFSNSIEGHKYAWCTGSTIFLNLLKVVGYNNHPKNYSIHQYIREIYMKKEKLKRKIKIKIS